MPILDIKGNVITTDHKKASPPKLGEKFAPKWSGEGDRQYFSWPGGSTVMFDLSKLTLADFRTMRDHYQVSATLAVLTFMVHQMEWRIECDNKKIADAVTANLENVWTQLVRGFSQAFWAGFSPNVLQWENDISGKTIQLKKVKDIRPEEACVNWKEVEGYAPPDFHVKPKIKVFDGIKIMGQGWPVPVENTFWYPLMMENGDYYGRKLLRPVFTSWYFSILMHLFSNRYFERFGEPVPVGRAPYEEEVTVGGKKVMGSDLMVQALQNLRSRAVVVLPNDRTAIGANGGAAEWDYSIEYLESQMRGADFERYLMRLDEEISIGLFTPLLILRTADVGSYNLGSTHWMMYLNMLNAIMGDIKSYLDPYILGPMVDYNFGTNAPRARIVFRKLGSDKLELVKLLLQSLTSNGSAMPDLVELGDIAGLTFAEVQAVTGDGTQTGGTGGTGGGAGTKDNPEAKSKGAAGKGKDTGGSGGKKSANNSHRVISDIAGRVAAQAGRYVKGDTGSASFEPSLGYGKQLEEALALDGYDNAATLAEGISSFGTLWLSDLPGDYLKANGSLGILHMTESVLIGRLEDLTNA